jgi:hypothetical protein
MDSNGPKSDHLIEISVIIVAGDHVSYLDLVPPCHQSTVIMYFYRVLLSKCTTRIVGEGCFSFCSAEEYSRSVHRPNGGRVMLFERSTLPCWWYSQVTGG